MNMRWLEVEIRSTQDASDAVCEALSRMGADGVSVCDPEEIRRLIESPDSLSYAEEGFIASFGADVIVKGYFAEIDGKIRIQEKESGQTCASGEMYAGMPSQNGTVEEATDLIRRKIDDIREFLPIGEGFSSYRFVEEEDWATSWKQYYDVIRVSPRIVICPTWKDYEKQEGEKVIFLDPGSAFGTGSHETTAMCIRLIDEIQNPGDIVLDLGCGSGILSIVSEKLGASYTEAMDIDALAVDVAKENFQANKSLVVCHTGELKDAKRQDYTLVAANIIADVICDLTPNLPDYLAPGARYIISGVIDKKKDRVLDVCKKAGFILKKEMTINDWWAFAFEK